MSRYALAESWEGGSDEAETTEAPSVLRGEAVRPDIPDAEAVRILQGNIGFVSNSEAFEILYRRHQAHVLRLLHLCGINSDADRQDLAQQVWMRVARAIRNFRSDSRFSTWLFRIVTNVAYTFHRSQKKPTFIRSDADDTDEIQEFHYPYQPTPLQLMVGSTLEAKIAALIQSRPRLAAIIPLLMEGFTPMEIAQRLGISDGNARIRCFRARQLLQQILEERQQEEEIRLVQDQADLSGEYIDSQG